MSIFSPYVMLGALLAVLTAFATGYMKGESDEFARQQTEIATLNAKARETEQRMATVAQTYAQTLRKANDVAKIKEIKLRNDIATGERRLFIPVSAPNCPIPTTADATTASGNTETRTELDRGIAQALVTLTSRGDQAIRQLNTCIDQYETMRNAK